MSGGCATVAGGPLASRPADSSPSGKVFAPHVEQPCRSPVVPRQRGVAGHLWLHGTLPSALALLIAAVASAILTMVVGTARIAQLHRLVGRRRDQRPR